MKRIACLDKILGPVVMLFGDVVVVFYALMKLLNKLNRPPLPFLVARHTSPRRYNRARAYYGTSLDEGTFTNDTTIPNNNGVLDGASP
jgi:hypothetical protein